MKLQAELKEVRAVKLNASISHVANLSATIVASINFVTQIKNLDFAYPSIGEMEISKTFIVR